MQVIPTHHKASNRRQPLQKDKMLKKIFILTILIIFCSCGTNTETNKALEHTDTLKNKSQVALDELNAIREEYKNVAAIWVFDYKKDFPVKLNQVNPDTLTPKKLVDFVSSANIHLDFIKVSNDTIFVKIKNSNYLTQSIGTTGAYSFMIITTFTLTELKGIKYVNFDFEEGDHASPGTYSRKYYEDLYKRNSH